MNTIFTLDDENNFMDKINLDDLYEKKQKHDLATTNNYNKILNRIHNRIKTISRTQLSEQFCWFIIPEMMIGVPRFDQSTCIAYVIDKLGQNGFKVRYTHPNLLFISWSHWIPSYVRNEIKKKAGISIDGNGNLLNANKNEKDPAHLDNTPNNLLSKFMTKSKEKDKDTKEIKSYKPTGNLIYNNEIMDSLKNKLDI